MTRLKEFLKALSDKDAKTYYVGGYVRDMILGKENKGIDIEKEKLEFIQFIKSVKEQYLTSKELMELGYEGQELGKALKEMKALACQGLTHSELLKIFKEHI